MGDALHICELAVTLDHQRRGIGRALITEAIDLARQRQLASITLATFRAIPWNEPTYRRMGFETIPTRSHDQCIANILQLEAEAGLPIARRCAMRLAFEPPA